ncbi:bile acid:sodium symporter family protein [Roseivirga sp. BDSF3-8]|uniref:bile acid:sodium symporter family protein n=1 Tax=Roseivirga sp. BDSF3-8 TaxID=3241598 RepID=UPI003531DC8E
MESSILTAVLLPLALGIIMLGMGLSLTPADFKRIFLYPKAATAGLLCQLVLLPLVAYLLCKAWNLEAELAVGIMILAACPGGATSNLIAHLAKGDTALSITLTAFSSLLAVITIPLIVNFAIVEFIPTGQEQQLDVLKTVLSVLIITLIPVAIGMLIRSRSVRFAGRMERPVRVMSAILLVAIIFAAILKERANVIGFFVEAGPVALSLNLVMLAIGYFGSRILRLNSRQSTTISIETGIQNGTLGIAIAATIIGNSQMAIPPAIYSLIMFFTAGVIIFLGNKKSKEEKQLVKS